MLAIYIIYSIIIIIIYIVASGHSLAVKNVHREGHGTTPTFLPDKHVGLDTCYCTELYF